MVLAALACEYPKTLGMDHTVSMQRVGRLNLYKHWEMGMIHLGVVIFSFLVTRLFMLFP